MIALCRIGVWVQVLFHPKFRNSVSHFHLCLSLFVVGSRATMQPFNVNTITHSN